MSKRIVVLSTEEKVAIRKILAKWIAKQSDRSYMSDAEFKEFNLVKRAYFSKFNNSTLSDD